MLLLDRSRSSRAGWPPGRWRVSPIIFLYVLGGLLAGAGGVENVVRSAIVPNVVTPDRVRGALALNFGL